MSVFKFIASNGSSKTAMCYILSLCPHGFQRRTPVHHDGHSYLSKTMNSVQLKLVAICLLHILMLG